MDKMIIDKKMTDRIEDMIGSTFMYRGRNVKVRGFGQMDNEVKIYTATTPVITTITGLGDTLDEFLPVSNESDVDRTVETVIVMKGSSGKMTQLEDILMANIVKLKQDPAYLKQAKEINSHANSIIKIAKTKVEMVREIRKASS